ncbi:MAG: hypothetical protein IJZ96_00680, partial [Lachnospiraceae bacterium]|nr:hypothetical protein [Lachnospiraceae bacterium]
MLKIASPFIYNVGLTHTYLEKYKKDNDAKALHQYVLCLLYGSNFVSEDGLVNRAVLDRLNKYLALAVAVEDVQPYEVLFYFELNKALKIEIEVEKILEKHPEYQKFGRLEVQSYDFLMHVGLYEGALTCCQDLYNIALINYTDYLNRYSLTLVKMNQQEQAYEFMLTALHDRDFFLPPFIITRLTKLAIEINKTQELLTE